MKIILAITILAILLEAGCVQNPIDRCTKDCLDSQLS
jgi:hypothetical protein